MPVVKSQDDLVALRKFACSGNEKFFLGTDSAPHYIEDKENETNVLASHFSISCDLGKPTIHLRKENGVNII